jgi:hypothetical protein
MSAPWDDGENVLVRFELVERQTAKAVVILIDLCDSEGVMLPKSKVAHIDEDAGEIWIPEWLATDRGLEYD